MGDFDIGGVDELSTRLLENGIDPEASIEKRRIDPDDIDVLEGWQAPADTDRARKIARRHGGDIMPVLVVKRGGGYETVNGVHRVEAARVLGMDRIRALVIGEEVFGLLFRDYGEVAMHEWAHRIAGTGYDP